MKTASTRRRKRPRPSGRPCLLLLLLLALLLLPSSTLSYHQLYTFDLTYTLSLPSPQAAYEEVLLVATLAGLVNRDRPRFFTRYQADADSFWWDFMQAHNFPPANNNEVLVLPDLDAVLEAFSSDVNQVILFDPAVPATSNVASTAAGVWNLLPVAYRPDDPSSIYSRYVAASASSGGRLHVKESMVGKFNNGSISGSAKIDVYLWAIDTFLLTETEEDKANPTLLAYFIDYFWTTVPEGSGLQGDAPSYDLNTASNHDYFVAHRAFFFDLNVWEDEPPNDDLGQDPLGLDRRVLEKILRAVYENTEGKEMITCGGFTPWKFKYVGWKHEGVETEWETAKLFSSYNVLLDADACCVGAMANAAFYQHYPLPERLLQQPAPTPQELLEKGYLIRAQEDDENTHTHTQQQQAQQSQQSEQSEQPAYRVPPTQGFYAFYVGDYDSSAWLYSQLHTKWTDPARGTVPLGWALNPNLSKRFPLAFALVYSTLTATDRITTGDSGAGYLNPTALFEPRPSSSHLADGSRVWKEWCLPYYQQFDLSFTGFLLNGAAGNMTHEAQQLYVEMSWDGMTNHRGRTPLDADEEGGGCVRVPCLEGNTPVFEEVDIPGGNWTEAAHVIVKRYEEQGGGSQFLIFRSILQTPGYHKEVVEAVRELQLEQQQRRRRRQDQEKGKHSPATAPLPLLEVVDPLTLAYVARIYLGGNNNDRVTYVDDTFPRHTGGAVAGRVLEKVEFIVRNNGFNDLDLNELIVTGSLTLAAAAGVAGAGAEPAISFVARGDSVKNSTGAITIEPGGEGTWVVRDLLLPSRFGLYKLEYGLRRLGILGRDFKDLGNPRYLVDVMIEEGRVSEIK